MEVVIMAGPAEVGAFAAGRIADVIAGNPEAVLGVATGSSPLEAYRSLAARRAEGLDFSRVSAFALDEYVGIARSHAESYHAVVGREVVEPLGLDPARVHVPDGLAADLDAACEDYEAKIAAAGGVDVQLLGIGANGHIGFNEPTSSLSSRTRVKTLAPRTRTDNARFFDKPEDVPVHCLTQGLGTILDARSVVLVAQGASKARAVAAMVEGPVSSMWPGSVLQLHRRATIVIDEAAAAELTMADYYRYTVEHRAGVQPEA
ncbi:glucosamine-6-phosphate deaminase [Pseudoclavibacter sp. 8L]|uniref:glucosamine-6-phosphate deaminase n=1 Tax=Pseudoclavibacter sp. 8L TaxID=2653162 RepID=UPI0012F214FB|nr:glucosamine-6-phosphate deaminase [Pseudoclavibacter sp. 8L]VXC24543.1 glucosamine-6-phosphate deaminase [Pseudoclavibacter sp. 8L]